MGLLPNVLGGTKTKRHSLEGEFGTSPSPSLKRGSIAGFPQAAQKNAKIQPSGGQGGGAGGVGQTAPAGGQAVLGNSARVRELEELLLKLDLMEKECIQEKLLEEAEAIKDEFIALKRDMYKNLMEVKEHIRSRHQIQKRKGNTVEVIQKGALIQSKLKELDMKLIKLKEVFKRQTKLKGKKYTESELDSRFQEVQVIKQQIEQSKQLYETPSIFSDNQIKEFTDFRSQMKQQGIALPIQEWREMTGEEQQAMDRWKARDAEIDVQVGEIGDAVDRLGEVALQIGAKATKQAELVASLHQQADVANEELISVNDSIKALLSSKDGCNFCMKIGLSVLLVGLIGYLISMIKNRITG